MRLTRWLTACGVLTVVFLCACSSSNGDAAGSGGDGGTNADSGACCPPDPAPGCCMHYGGWASAGQCLEACDGMPGPGDPGWKLTKDDHGCSIWSNDNESGNDICGEALPVLDSGSDADSGLDAQTD